jgi:type IV pilus assembly protein PilW
MNGSIRNVDTGGPKVRHRAGSRGRFRSNVSGLSLIEIMVALAIAAILLFGLGQIFVGSKNVYRLQEGMSRVQENARFMLQYLESNVRMAGYMGCGNDVDLTTKAGSPPAFLNHLRPQSLLKSPEYFQRPIEAFAYTGGAIDNQDPTRGAAGDWTPTLPNDLDLSGDMPVKGSDVLVLRIIGADSTPLLGNFNMAAGQFNVADPNLVKAGGIYAITNCANARIFKASARAAGSNPVIAGPADNLLFLTADTSSTWIGTYANMQFNQSGTMLNAEVHPAQYLVLYVGLRDLPTPTPVLKVLMADSTGATAPTELADDVEMMKLQFGVDTDNGGAVDKYVDANDAGTNLGATVQAQRDIAWRKVLSVRIALLMRSQDRASAVPHTGDAAGDNVFYLYDSRVQRPNDSRFRDVYTTTVALRNRLGNY